MNRLSPILGSPMSADTVNLLLLLRFDNVDKCLLDRVVAILFLVVSPLVLLSQAMGIAELFASFSLFPRQLVSTTFLALVGSSDFPPAPIVKAVLVRALVVKLELG